MNASKLSGNASTHVGLAIASLLAVGGAFLACGGDKDDGTSSGDDNATGKVGALGIRFSPMYSAFDGEHEFKLPVVAQGTDPNTGKVGVIKGATFKAADPSKVSIEPTDDGAVLTMKGSGDVKITATKDGESATATLHIAKATPEQYQAGYDRYNNMMSALPGGTGLMSLMSINKDGACTTCHGQTAMIFKVMHTPQQTGGYSDDDLKTIFTKGDKPEGYEQRSGIPECLWGMGHQWNVPDPDGLIVYLRSIPPQTQGCFDFPTPNLGDAGFRIPPGLFGGGGDAGGACGSLPIPANICSLIAGFSSGDGGFTIPPGFLNGDGGFRIPPGLLNGDGGFRIPGLGGDAGTGTGTGTTPPASSGDAGTTTTPSTTADAGA